MTVQIGSGFPFNSLTQEQASSMSLQRAGVEILARVDKLASQSVYSIDAQIKGAVNFHTSEPTTQQNGDTYRCTVGGTGSTSTTVTFVAGQLYTWSSLSSVWVQFIPVIVNRTILDVSDGNVYVCTSLGPPVVWTSQGSFANLALLTPTAGSVTASKAVIVDANKDIGAFRNVGLAGNLAYSGLSGANQILMPDNLASALVIGEGANAYITFTTSNGTEAITVAKATAFSSTVTIGGSLITLAGAFGTSGAHACTLTLTDDTNITLPTSGTLLAQALTSGNVFVGSAGNVATGVAMSGDVTIIASGTTTLNAVHAEQVHRIPVAALGADADLATTVVFAVPRAGVISYIGYIPIGTDFGTIGDSNTSVFTVAQTGGTIAAKTFNTSTQPTANALNSLGSLTNATLTAGLPVTLAITNGSTAKTPGGQLIIVFTPTNV